MTPDRDAAAWQKWRDNIDNRLHELTQALNTLVRIEERMSAQSGDINRALSRLERMDERVRTLESGAHLKECYKRLNELEKAQSRHTVMVSMWERVVWTATVVALVGKAAGMF